MEDKLLNEIESYGKGSGFPIYVGKIQENFRVDMNKSLLSQ